MLTRRNFISKVGVGAAGGLIAAPAVVSLADAAKKIVVASPFGFTREYSDLFYAYSGGFYSREGLDAKVIATLGVQSIQQLIAGQVQFIRNVALDVITAVERQHLPLKAIATLSNRSTYNFVTLEKTNIRKPADLVGKTVGITAAVGGASSIYLKLIMQHADTDPESVMLQPVGNTPAAAEYVKQGRIDGFMCTIDVVDILRGNGEKIVVWNTDEFFRLPCHVYVTTQSLIEKDPDVVTRFMRAIKGSVDAIIDKPFAPILEKELKDFELTDVSDPTMAIKLQDNQVKELWLSEGRDNVLRNIPGIWSAGAATVAQFEKFSNTDPSRYYDSQFVEAILKG